MLFTPVGALLAKPDPVRLMKPQTGLMEGKEGKQKEKRQSYTQSSLLFLSVWRKWIPTKYNATGMHHYTWPSPPLHSGWGEVGEEKWRKRYLTIDGYAQEGGERHPVTKQLLCQKTRRTTHACKDTYTHTNVGKVNKEEAEWKQECQNDVAEGDHSILTALTAHTHTHTQAMHTSRADCQRWASAIENVIIGRKCPRCQVLFLQHFLPQSYRESVHIVQRHLSCGFWH